MSDSIRQAQDKPIRVLITDDHFIVRQGLRLITEYGERHRGRRRSNQRRGSVAANGRTPARRRPHGFTHAGDGWSDRH